MIITRLKPKYVMSVCGAFKRLNNVGHAKAACCEGYNQV